MLSVMTFQTRNTEVTVLLIKGTDFNTTKIDEHPRKLWKYKHMGKKRMYIKI